MKNLRWRIFNEGSFKYNKLVVIIQSKNNKKRIAERNRKDQNWFSLHKLGIGKWTSLKRVHQVLWWKGSACLHHGLLLKCTPSPPIEYLLQYLPHPHLLQQSIPIPLINLVFSNPLDLPQCLQSPLHDWTFYHSIVALIGTVRSYCFLY